MEILFFIGVLIFSVVLHEAAHGYMANYLGDPTPRLQGRLTLNPISHIDPFGSVILPGLLLLTQPLTGVPFLIGWARPVPYNPYNLRGRYGEGLVAAAGPATNILLALIFGLAIRFFYDTLGPELVAAFSVIVFINILLAIFNMLPVPPLDGSKVLSSFLPGALGRAYDSFRFSFERLGFFTGIILIFVLLYLFLPYLSQGVRGMFSLLTGVVL